MRIGSVLIYLFIYLSRVTAQIHPVEASSLNYRLVGFSTNTCARCKYTLQIAKGTFTTRESFSRRVIRTIYSDKSRILVEVPSFGESYTWSISCSCGKTEARDGVLHHFSTLMAPEVDTDANRLRITKKNGGYSQMFCFLDGTGVLYSMAGKPIWFLPRNGDFEDRKGEIRDMKISPYGTVTFLYQIQGVTSAYEVNYEGDIVWKSKMSHGWESERYHHQFNRLPNGHYMILSSSPFGYKPDSSGLPIVFLEDNKIKYSEEKSYTHTQLETIVEYNEQGKKVWSWNAANYISESDIANKRTPEGMVNTKLHCNAFFFDSEKNVLYLSFKALSRVVKLQYPQGTVLNSYGRRHGNGNTRRPDDLFCGQHCCRISDGGNLYLFNNNDCHFGDMPKVVMMKEPESNSEKIRKVWEYDCTVDSVSSPQGAANVKTFVSGGSVFELKDHAIFVSMSSDYSRLLVVGQNKQVLWSGFAEHKEGKEWKITPQYRASIIDRIALSHFVWQESLQDLFFSL